MAIHVEAAIRDAIARGLFDDLPGKGKPLVFEDDSHVPVEERMAYRILRKEGIAPAEVVGLKKVAEERAAIADAETEEERRRLRVKAATRESFIRARLERRR